MSTTLPLFWHLSAASKKERIDASVKLISALEHFQAHFSPKDPSSAATSEDEDEQQPAARGDGLNAFNAQDVSYSIRRLARGLASPRESSRLGFAVALTELLSRIDTVTCSQIVTLILDSAKSQGSMTGQEERDVLFARMFGLTSVIQSGLLVRDAPLSTSASSQTAASTLGSYQQVLNELLALGEKKSWLRESAWWTIGLAVDALGASELSWKSDALDATMQAIFTDNKIWTPEKIALTLKLQKYCPDSDWNKLLSPTFKHSRIVHTGNYGALARILKDLQVDDDDETDIAKSKVGTWKPQVHFVWDILLDQVLAEGDATQSDTSFPEFFRILVDESLFSAATSPERKYWGFQIFQKALPRVGEADIPMLFTKNFMRSWINHLSNSDRYLHKAAKQVANDIQDVVKSNPTVGFTLILQLTGVHGSHQFDRLTKTKTVETILTSMNNEGIQNYIEYLLRQVNDEHGSKTAEVQALNARRAWIIDQLASLVRNGAIPKDDQWIQTILDWFAVHGLFIVKKKSEKAGFLALRTVPDPVFSDNLRRSCRERLLSSLAELTSQSSVVKSDDKTAKLTAVASDGQFWVARVLSSIEQLDKDTKHVTRLSEVDEDDQALRQKARELISRLRTVSGEQRDAARGAELLLSATLLHQYCIDDDDEADAEALEGCIDGASRMFLVEGKKSKKTRKATDATDGNDAPAPADVLVDIVIGFLEKATAYMRAVGNQVFTLLCDAVQESTIDLILAQLERRDPAELLEDADDEMEEDEEAEDAAEDNDSSSEEDGDADEDDDDDEDLDEAADPELRRKIKEALRVNGVQAASDDESDEDLMDDDQMMAIDEQLAAVFRARADERKLGKGVDAQREATHYKNRVLDLLETFIKRKPTSAHIVRLVLPLVELVVSTGSDEKQLSDKATGILRSRIGKLKDVPEDVDAEQVGAILRELHLRARKAASKDIVATLSQCSLYTARCLGHAQSEDAVREAYRESLVDFATRKASRLNANFVQDFIRRHPDMAWGIRNELLDVATKSVNGYRQLQVFQLMQTLISQLASAHVDSDETLEFMKGLKQAIQGSVRDACDDDRLTAAHVKELLKIALAGIRYTKRVAPESAKVQSTWDAPAWEALSETLAKSERLKNSVGLQTMCKQIVQLVNQDTSKSVKGAAKRKVDVIEDEEAEAEDEGEGEGEHASPKKSKRRTKKPKM